MSKVPDTWILGSPIAKVQEMVLWGSLDICNEMVEQFLISPEQHSVWRGHFHVDVAGDRVEVPLILEQGVDPILVQLRRIRISIYKKDQDQKNIFQQVSFLCEGSPAGWGWWQCPRHEDQVPGQSAQFETWLDSIEGQNNC